MCECEGKCANKYGDKHQRVSESMREQFSFELWSKLYVTFMCCKKNENVEKDEWKKMPCWMIS